MRNAECGNGDEKQGASVLIKGIKLKVEGGRLRIWKKSIID